MEGKYGEILIYQTEDGLTSIDVKNYNINSHNLEVIKEVNKSAKKGTQR